MQPQDFASQSHFFRWFSHRCVEEPDFPWQILFTYKAKFTKEAALNSCNSHVWAEGNPHAVHPHEFQEQYSLNIWARFLNGYVIGPYLLPPWVPHTCDSLKAYCMGSWKTCHCMCVKTYTFSMMAHHLIFHLRSEIIWTNDLGNSK